jgi:hypothetical protein
MRRRKGFGCGAFGLRFDAVLLRTDQQTSAQIEPGGAMTVGEEAVVANAMQAIGQCVQQEAPDKLVGIERHDLRPAAVAIILPAAGNAIVLHADQPGIGNRDAVGVARGYTGSRVNLERLLGAWRRAEGDRPMMYRPPR